MNAISMLIEAKQGENYVFTPGEMKVFVAILKKEETEPLRKIIEGLECECHCAVTDEDCPIIKAKKQAREEV